MRGMYEIFKELMGMGLSGPTQAKARTLIIGRRINQKAQTPGAKQSNYDWWLWVHLSLFIFVLLLHLYVRSVLIVLTVMEIDYLLQKQQTSTCGEH